MANTILEVQLPEGLTGLTVFLYALNDDSTIQNGSGDSLVASTNATGFYRATIAENLSDTYRVHVETSSGTGIYSGYVNLQNDTGTYKASDTICSDESSSTDPPDPITPTDTVNIITTGLNARTPLQALNTILAAFGESPVTDYYSEHLDVVTARQTLEETILEVCEDRAWSWNTDLDYKLERNGSNEIVLSEVFTTTNYTEDEMAMLDIRPDKNQRRNLTVRGGKVYDRENQTYTLTQDVVADVRWYVTWGQLPNAARYYITLRAARKFSDRAQGSEQLHQYLSREESVAYQRLSKYEVSKVNANALKNNPVLWR